MTTDQLIDRAKTIRADVNTVQDAIQRGSDSPEAGVLYRLAASVADLARTVEIHLEHHKHAEHTWHKQR